METWHENDEFWKAMAPMMFSEQRWDGTPVEVDQILSLLGISPGTAILDLCCGPGRHSLELARRGFSVTGVDRTAAYLEEARGRATAENLAIELVQEDMRDFCRPDSFDAALSMYTSFGYFEDPTDNRKALVNVNSSLREGGVLILEVMGKEVLAHIFKERDWTEKDGVFWLQERKVRRDWSWMENRWILLRDREQHEFKISHWLYSASELSKMLLECGFTTADVYGDLEGAPYDHTARSLVIVARRQGVESASHRTWS